VHVVGTAPAAALVLAEALQGRAAVLRPQRSNTHRGPLPLARACPTRHSQSPHHGRLGCWTGPWRSSPQPNSNHGRRRCFFWNNCPRQGLRSAPTASLRNRISARRQQKGTGTGVERSPTQSEYATWPRSRPTPARSSDGHQPAQGPASMPSCMWFRKNNPSLHHQLKNRLTIFVPYTQLLKRRQDQRQESTKT